MHLPKLAQWRALIDFTHAQVFGTEWTQFLGIISTGSFHLYSTAGIVSVLRISQWEAEFKWSCLNEVMLLATCSLKGWDFSSYTATIRSCFPGGPLVALPGCRHKRIALCYKLKVKEQKQTSTVQMTKALAAHYCRTKPLQYTKLEQRRKKKGGQKWDYPLHP